MFASSTIASVAIKPVSDLRYIAGMRNRLRELRVAADMTQEEVAEAIDLHWTNYSKLENGHTTLREPIRSRLADLFKVTPLELLSDTMAVRVQGHVQAGNWAETWEIPEGDQYEVALPRRSIGGDFEVFAAETRGPSMDKIYPEGTVVIFAKITDTGEALIVGKRYIVERVRTDGLREMTVKTLWRADDGTFWLVPESNDPRFQAPIPIAGVEGETVEVVGRVLYSVRKE